jgi:hypothetical protein
MRERFKYGEDVGNGEGWNLGARNPEVKTHEKEKRGY